LTEEVDGFVSYRDSLGIGFMDRWIFALALAAFVAVGGFWLLLSNSRTGTLSPDASGRLHLRHGLLFRMYAGGLFLGLELLLGSLVLFFPPASNVATGLLVAAALVALVLGIILMWDASRFALTISQAGLECRSPWRGPRTIPWTDVERVSFSPANLWFAIEPKTGPPFHVLAIVPGVSQFLAACEANLPVEKLFAAEPGYDWVWRKFPHVKGKPPCPKSPILRWLKWFAITVLGGLLLAVGLFAFNGLVLASRDTPVVREFPVPHPAGSGAGPRQVVVMSFNISKAFAHRGNFQFDTAANVTAQLDRLAKIIQVAKPDVVCLQDVMTEAGTMPVDQVEFLAKAARLPYSVFGEHYNVGVPGYRIVGGNAILSRIPLLPVANLSLSGRAPFYSTTNSHRALFAETVVHGQTVLIGCLHNDSLDPDNNDRQMEQILAFVGERPCILAGDFNAVPASPSIARVKDSAKYVGAFDGQNTTPAAAPTRQLHYIFAPAPWTHAGTDVLITALSLHRPLVAAFTVAEEK
jgi:endonuclease/exonuclease/phosphatase family metal-dependent hydrolase